MEAKVCNDAVARHRVDSNPALRFLREAYVMTENENDFVVAKDTYVAYRTAYEEWGHDKRRALTDGMFGKEVVRAFPYLKKYQEKNKDGRATCKKVVPNRGRVPVYLGLRPAVEEGE